MADLPVANGSDDVHAHAPHTGHRVVDLTIAVCAITISVISLFVAIGHGRTEEKLVAATSWPFLVFTLDRHGPEKGKGDVTTLSVQNVGVGPANVKSLVVRLDGKAVVDHQTFMRTCCGYRSAGFQQDAKAGFYGNSGAVGVIAARAHRDLLAWREVPTTRASFDALSQVEQRLSFSACYCSVLDQCWTTDLKSTTTPHPVSSCDLDARSYHG